MVLQDQVIHLFLMVTPEPTEENRRTTPPAPPTGLTELPASAGVGVTDRAALPLWCGDLLTTGQKLALDFFTKGHALLADADPTRFWPPELLLLVCSPGHGAARTIKD